MANSPITQDALSAIAARGKQQGPQGAVAVLVAAQQDNQKQMQKLLQTIEKLQQENAETVQQAAQAGGGAATQVANQVSRGMEKAAAQSQRKQERAEDKDFAVQQQELNAKLQKDAAREAAMMGAAIQASRDKYITSINTMKDQQENLDASTIAYTARIEERVRAGQYTGPEGRKALQRQFDLIKQSKVFGDNMFNTKHKQAAFEAHNEEMERILDSTDPMAILNMQTNPLNLPMPTLKGPKSKIAPLSALTPQQQFDMELTGGYPLDGLVFGPGREENWGLPEGEEPNMIDPSTMMDILNDQMLLDNLTDGSLRQEGLDGIRKRLVETHDKLGKLKEVRDGFNKTYNMKAQQGVEAALEDFVSDEDPAKFNDPARYIMTRSLIHTFGGGPQGEEITQIALELFDGKWEPRSSEEFYAAAAIESASFNIRGHLASEVMGMADPEKGGAFATQLVKQMIAQVGRENALRALGVDPSNIELVDAQAAMGDIIAGTSGFAGRMNDGIKGVSILKQFREQYRSNLRQLDLHAYVITAEGGQREARLGELMSQLNRPPGEGGLSLNEIQARGPGDQSGFKDMRSSMSLIDGLLGMSKEIGPNAFANMSGFITNHLDPVTNGGDLKAYNDQIEVERQRSGFAKAAVDFSKFAYERQKEGKRLQQAQPQRAELAATPETFQKRGGVGVVAKQLPALISLGHHGLRSRLTTDVTSMVTGVLGKGAGTAAARGALAVFKGQQPVPLPGETAQMQNLTLAEKQQIIRESNQRN